MALTDEQRSMLQLLLSGQSYDDIASLLGISRDEVRARARQALQQIGGADPDAQVAVSDYLLGQADPIGRADAVRHLQNDPGANALAANLISQLRLLAPQADLPEIPAPRGRAAPASQPPRVPTTPPSGPPGAPPVPEQPTAAPAPAGESRLGRLGSRVGAGLRGISSSKRNAQLAIGLGALGVLVVAGGLAIAGVFGGDGEGSGCQSIDTSQAQEAGVPTVTLNPTEEAADQDCPPTGQITLTSSGSQQGQDQAAQFGLQINAANLEPTEGGEAYVLWLFRSETESLPLGQQTVDSTGNLTGGVPLRPEGVLLLPNFQTIRLARLTSSETQQIQQDLQNPEVQGFTQFVGTPVLEGTISELGLEELLQQAQGAGGQGAGGQGAGGQGAGGQ